MQSLASRRPSVPTEVNVVLITKQPTKENHIEMDVLETHQKDHAAQVRSSISWNLWCKQSQLWSRLIQCNKISKAAKSPSDFLALRHTIKF